MMGDRTVLADNRWGHCAHMNHDEILNVGASSDTNLKKLSASHNIRPNGGARANGDFAIEPGTLVNERRVIQRYVVANVSHENILSVSSKWQVACGPLPTCGRVSHPTG